MQIPSKLPDVGVTIFTVMTQLANAHQAINLGQGFPDFNPDPTLMELVSRFMREGHNQYAPMQGVLALREAIAVKTRTSYGAVYDPATEITVTSGATEAIFAAIAAVVRPGDEVIVIEPAYDAYIPVVTLNGGVPRFAEYRHPSYRVDWDQVKDLITPKTRLLIINSPHNPTGAVWDTADINALKEIVTLSDMFILSDEVYEHIVFDGCPHESMVRHPELAQRSFVVSSFGKTYHTTGWKVGYCLAPAYLSRELQRIHQFLTFASHTPTQLAYAEILQKADLYQDLAIFYQQKRDGFHSLMQASRFDFLPCGGTYFQLAAYDAINDMTETDFARWLTQTHQVAAIPVSPFYHDHKDRRVVRFCFAKNDETLKEAAQRLCRI